MIANGYQIIDLKGRKLENGETAQGLYAELEALEKMPVFINCTYTNESTDTELVPFTSTVGTFGDYKSFILTSAYDYATSNLYIIVCSVASDDTVAIDVKTIA